MITTPPDLYKPVHTSGQITMTIILKPELEDFLVIPLLNRANLVCGLTHGHSQRSHEQDQTLDCLLQPQW